MSWVCGPFLVAMLLGLGFGFAALEFSGLKGMVIYDLSVCLLLSHFRVAGCSTLSLRV